MISRRFALEAAGALAASRLEAATLPNFVLITCDDLGYADIEPFGARPGCTPNLARMAREGVRFTSFYAAPVCSPSRAALMTGCYPRRVGLDFGSWHAVLMPGDWHGLNPGEITVARLLKSRGYATACIGKWHLGDQPEFLPARHGFDEYYGLPYSNDMRPSPKPAGAIERPHPPLPLLRNDKVVREVTDQGFLTSAYTEEALRFLRRSRGKPFFLYLPHSMVHAPLAAGPRFLNKTGKGLFADALAEVDWSVGEILSFLERQGLARNTLVIFLSDNGGTPRSNNAPLRGNKGSIWEGGVRVPAIFRWPGRIREGKSTDEIASNMDILPTLARLAGAEPPRDRKIDGHDLWDLLAQPGAKSGYDAFFYHQTTRLSAVRAGPWKLHTTGELYDLAGDAGESHNVASEHPDVVTRLNRKLAEARADLGDGEQKGPGCRPVGKAKGPLRFWIPRHPDSGYPPHAPVKYVAGSPVS